MNYFLYFCQMIIPSCRSGHFLSVLLLYVQAVPHRREAIGKPRNLNFQECLFV